MTAYTIERVEHGNITGVETIQADRWEVRSGELIFTKDEQKLVALFPTGSYGAVMVKEDAAPQMLVEG